jgi:hypothetical protein
MMEIYISHAELYFCPVPGFVLLSGRSSSDDTVTVGMANYRFELLYRTHNRIGFVVVMVASGIQ